MCVFFFQAEDGIRDVAVTGVQTCALPILVEGADSESPEELLEEGQTFEAGIVSGVENAPDPDQGEVRTHEVTQDDVPEEYDDKDRPRSEEHTSELQSRLHLVCRLLLEKKKNNIVVANFHLRDLLVHLIPPFIE